MASYHDLDIVYGHKTLANKSKGSKRIIVCHALFHIKQCMLYICLHAPASLYVSSFQIWVLSTTDMTTVISWYFSISFCVSLLLDATYLKPWEWISCCFMMIWGQKSNRGIKIQRRRLWKKTQDISKMVICLPLSIRSQSQCEVPAVLLVNTATPAYSGVLPWEYRGRRAAKIFWGNEAEQKVGCRSDFPGARGGQQSKAKQTKPWKAEDRRNTSHLRTPETDKEAFYLDQPLLPPSFAVLCCHLCLSSGDFTVSREDTLKTPLHILMFGFQSFHTFTLFLP